MKIYSKYILLIACLALIIICPAVIFGIGFELTDDPIVGFPDNTVIDFAIHNDAIWLITGNGVSFLPNDNPIWQYYDTTNGLMSHAIASIYSGGDRLWLGIVPPENAEAGNYLAFTDDDGFTWDTLLIDTAYDYSNPIYDITGADSVIFFTSMVSGLRGSFDGGNTWRNIYYSIMDSAYSNSTTQYTNHYFAATIDTFHTDSTVVWGGTANGLMRFVFAPAYARPNSNNILNLASGDGFLFICGDSGLTRLNFPNSREAFRSFSVSDGLPGRAISAAHFAGGRLLVGTLDSMGGSGAGLVLSDDSGLTYRTSYAGLGGLIGENKYPKDFISVGDVIYMAGFEAGLYKSIDTGKTWTNIPFDVDPTSGRNIVHSLDIDSAYLWAGTDSGLVRLTLDLDNDAAIVDDSNIVFTDTPTTGGRATKVRVQPFYGDDDIRDSTTIWTILHPLDEAIGEYGVFYSSDNGANWDIIAGYKGFDIEFADSLVYMSGPNNLSVTQDRIVWLSVPGGEIEDSTGRSIVSFNGLDINSIEIVDDTIYLGSSHGLAVSPAGSNRWRIFLADDNPQHYSSVDRYGFDGGLTGDWVNALAIQPSSQQIWASSHPGPSYTGQNGISVISLDGQLVEDKYVGSRVWNFAFSNQNIFAAADVGLLFSSNDGATWDTLTIMGTLANSPSHERFDLNSVPVYGVLVTGDTLWVGTEEGAASIDIDDLGFDLWQIHRVHNPDPSEEVYAYPVPYSPYAGTKKLIFQYPVPQAANATVEVYDFAMNLVRTVVSAKPKLEGITSVDEWDGRNGWGKIVAVGIYYFKVSLSTGEIYWGKLAIMP